MYLKVIKEYFDEMDLTNVEHFILFVEEAPGQPSATSAIQMPIPVVAGQTGYEVDFPATYPLEPGKTYNLGIAAANNSGGVTDIDVLNLPLAPIPVAPKWRR